MRAAPCLLLLATALATSPSPAWAVPQPIAFAERELFESPGDNMVAGNLDESLLPELVGVRDGDVLIRRNLGGRRFAESIVVPMASGTIAGPVLADLDGDGRLDLVAWRATHPALFIRLNQGGLTFAPTVTYALTAAPSGACGGDLNGDSRDDIVVLRSDGFTAFLAGPGGDLSAATPQSIVPAELSLPQIANINGDGTTDLALYVRRYNDVTIEWFAGGGDGTFGPSHVAMAARGDAFVLADLDQDGDKDIVQSDGGWNLNDGAGTFAGAVWISPSIACRYYTLSVGDLDQDGAQDIVLAGSCGGSAQQNTLVVVAYAVLDDASRHIARWHVPRDPSRVELADFDGDGHLDVAAHCYNSSDYAVIMDASKDHPIAAGFNDWPTAILWSDGHGTLMGKLDIPLRNPDFFGSYSNYAAHGLLSLHTGPGAGGPDLLAGEHADMFLLRNRGHGDFYPPVSIGRGTPRAAADLDASGTDDLVFTTSDSTWVRLRAAAGGGFETPVLIEASMPFIGIADVDGDGAPDLALEGDGSSLWMRPGDGTGGFGPARDLIGTLPEFHGSVLLEDLNHDGRADLVVPEGYLIEEGDFSDPTYKAVLHVLLNDGHGALTSDVTDTLTFHEYGFGFRSTVASGDVDGDGDRDIVLLRHASSNPSWFGAFLNDGAGGFDVAGLGRYSGTPGGLVVCSDLNLDGLSDVMFHDSDGYDLDFRVVEALGAGQFGELQHRVGVHYAGGMVAGDFDTDGRPDVALLDVYEGRVAVMLNTTPYGPTPTQLALASARVVDDAIELEWHAPGPEVFSAQLERNDGATWHPLATLTSDGLGQVRYRDADVTRGARYGYRLRYRDGARELLTAESWVELPALTFALRAPSPSPVRGVPAFGVSLPSRGDAALEILDIAGRRVREQRLSGLAPGDHRVSLEGAPLSPGLYFARLRLAEASARVRFVVIR